MCECVQFGVPSCISTYLVPDVIMLGGGVLVGLAALLPGRAAGQAGL